ncbi:AbiJ-NTD4 domain-containing protein [Xenophilus azovorans]|uniref:AbiJ-NTD4 domain-containing protein n=1 Tax=Xenophilus azovorans TaxID=151755 RepID=UPI0005716002
MSDYFSDRELGPRARTEQEISPVAWAGIVALASSLANSGAFGASFPERCPDGQAICGNELSDLKSAIEAELDGLSWPPQTEHVVEEGFTSTREPWAPTTLMALDFVEFVWRKVALPVVGRHHDYFQHHHLTFDIEAGRASFRADVNRILARNGLAYELGEDGQIRRVLPAVLGETLARTYFRTGERTLDVMLEESRTKFSDPDPLIRREALERLFDAWERIKSLADANKAKSVQQILDRSASEPAFREALEKEARELTQIGNSHLLRHHEVSQTPVIDVEHVDYLYHRLFAMVELVIRRNAPR